MNFIDWFDPHNSEHMEAASTLATTGAWPEGFITEDVVLGSYWMVDLYASMAGAWQEYFLAQQHKADHKEVCDMLQREDDFDSAHQDKGKSR